jgi:rhodanese-related sulfurtransferase
MQGCPVMVALIGRTALLVLASAGLGVAINRIRPDGVRLTGPSGSPTACSAATAATTPAAGLPAVEVLAPVEAMRLCGDRQTLMADVRDAASFAQGHVSGAIHLPCAASGSVAAAAVDSLGDRRTLIVYGNDTNDARLVADEMRGRIGRSDVRVLVLAGGFPAWNQAGLACSSGPCPACAPPAGLR